MPHWVDATRQHLHTIFADAEIEDSLLVHGYWHICGMASQFDHQVKILNSIIGEGEIWEPLATLSVIFIELLARYGGSSTVADYMEILILVGHRGPEIAQILHQSPQNAGVRHSMSSMPVAVPD